MQRRCPDSWPHSPTRIPIGAANVQSGLAGIFEHWSWDDPRSTDLAVTLAEAFGRSSLAGQQSVLKLEADWLKPHAKGNAAPPTVLEADTKLAQQAVSATGKEVRADALRLLASLLLQPGPAELVSKWRDATRLGLRDSEPEVREHAIQLAQAPALSMLEQVVPLLHDTAPNVRRAAILAVGPSPTAMTSEDLLPWLHDPDPEVRRLCEVALRSRSDITEENLRLGRLITDPRTPTRLQAINELLINPDREPTEWLRRLSHDPVPSVRVAAIRAAVLRPRVDLTDRIREMTRSDPSPSICQLAQFYLTLQEQQRLSWGEQ